MPNRDISVNNLRQPVGHIGNNSMKVNKSSDPLQKEQEPHVVVNMTPDMTLLKKILNLTRSILKKTIEKLKPKGVIESFENIYSMISLTHPVNLA